jgi:hypothetical protein
VGTVDLESMLTAFGWLLLFVLGSVAIESFPLLQVARYSGWRPRLAVGGILAGLTILGVAVFLFVVAEPADTWPGVTKMSIYLFVCVVSFLVFGIWGLRCTERTLAHVHAWLTGTLASGAGKGP